MDLAKLEDMKMSLGYRYGSVRHSDVLEIILLLEEARRIMLIQDLYIKDGEERRWLEKIK